MCDAVLDRCFGWGDAVEGEACKGGCIRYFLLVQMCTSNGYRESHDDPGDWTEVMSTIERVRISATFYLEIDEVVASLLP